MMNELVPYHETRPSWIIHEDWKVFVYIHDRWFLSELSRFRKLLIKHHPDRGGNHSKFIRVRDEYRTFLIIENHYYRELKLNPPRIIFQTSMERDRKCKFCNLLIGRNRHYNGYCDINCYSFKESLRQRSRWKSK